MLLHWLSQLLLKLLIHCLSPSCGGGTVAQLSAA
jgi:hypothetical protein